MRSFTGDPLVYLNLANDQHFLKIYIQKTVPQSSLPSVLAGKNWRNKFTRIIGIILKVTTLFTGLFLFWGHVENRRITPAAQGEAAGSVRLLLTKKPRPFLKLPRFQGPRYHVCTVPETPADIWLAIGPLHFFTGLGLLKKIGYYFADCTMYMSFPSVKLFKYLSVVTTYFGFSRHSRHSLSLTLKLYF